MLAPMKLIGKLTCLFKGHKRGKFVRFDRIQDEPPILMKVYACPRCLRETRYSTTTVRRTEAVPGRPDHDMTTSGTPLRPGQ